MAVTQTLTAFLMLFTRGKPHEYFSTAPPCRFSLGRGRSRANCKHFISSLCHLPPPALLGSSSTPGEEDKGKSRSGDSTFSPWLFPNTLP